VAEQAVALRLATLAPDGSPWMRVFNAWNLTVKEQTNNTLELGFTHGGSEGDERDFVRKMRASQIDGAALTTTGLGRLVRSVLVLSVPGVIVEYEQLDQVRDELNARFERMFDDEGYTLLGWSDAGKTRLLSTEKIERPSDIKKLRPWLRTDGLIFAEFLKMVGANPVRLGVPEVYAALQTRTVDTVHASALAAVSLQWHTQLKYISKSNSGIIVGATLIRKDSFEALTEDQQKVLAATGARAHKALNRLVRREDDKSYATLLKQGITAVDMSEHEAEWDEAGKHVRERLAGRAYSKSLLDEVVAAAGKQE
jgi:TRAP-type C4-dicarboxylate transport system substrate-binding protein